MALTHGGAFEYSEITLNQDDMKKIEKAKWAKARFAEEETKSLTLLTRADLYYEGEPEQLSFLKRVITVENIGFNKFETTVKLMTRKVIAGLNPCTPIHTLPGALLTLISALAHALHP